MIPGRGRDIPSVQLPCNIPIAHAGEPPLKDFPDHRRSLRVRLNPVIIVRAFLIAIRCPSPDKFSIPLLCRKHRKHLPGNVLAVNGVHDVFQRHNVAVLGPLGGQCVKVIIDRNKPHIQEGKNSLQIFASFPVVPAKPG